GDLGKAFRFRLWPKADKNGQRGGLVGVVGKATTKEWGLRKNGTRRKNSSLVSNWTNCWCSGSRKHRGLEKPRRTHYSKRFSTSIGPTRISSRSAPSSRSFTRKECEIRFENRTKSASSWSKGTTASNCQRLVGYATATAVKFSARYAASPSASRLASGASASTRSSKSSH